MWLANVYLTNILKVNYWSFIWTGTFHRAKVFDKSWHLTACEKNISKFVLPEREESQEGNFSLVLFKSFALYDKNKIHPEPFMMVGTSILPKLRIWFDIFHILLDPSRLLSALASAAYA